MASGFTRPVELSRSGLDKLVGRIKSGAPALASYAKGAVTKANGVQPASGSKLRKR